MVRFRASVDWALRPDEDFPKGRYVRGHTVTFEPGPRVRGTASAHVVGARWAEAVPRKRGPGSKATVWPRT